MRNDSPSPAKEGIIARIFCEGTLTFKEFMEAALYHPELGYYTTGPRPGRQGDFFTNVSIGSVFGDLLADYVHALWKLNDPPEPFTILEEGGNTGALAGDLLLRLYAKFPALCKQFRFLASERMPHAMTDPRLEPFADVWEQIDDPFAIAPDTVDVAYSNELLDAFPVHRVVWEGPEVGWRECTVRLRTNGQSLTWDSQPITHPLLNSRLDRIDTAGFQPGHLTEVNLDLGPWLQRHFRTLRPGGTLLIFDYGITGNAYHTPSRPEGTLRAYHQHQLRSDLLAHPGQQDLTAHVDFAELERDATAKGFELVRLVDQSRFLTECARDALLEMEQSLAGKAPDAAQEKWFRQFRQLISMGPTFKVLELRKPKPNA